MAFTQTITLRTAEVQSLTDLLETWHREQSGVAPGYLGARLLADRDGSGQYIVEVDFSDAEEAKRNNDRPETRAWADELRGLAETTPVYDNYEVAYATR